jgi:transposase
MQESITWVGLDAHKKEHHVAMRPCGQEEVLEWTIKNEGRAIRRMVRKIVKHSEGDARVCYEAGPCGFALQRQIEACGVKCVVVAPSLIPVKPGERVKTDRRDARKLLELFEAGLLTTVCVPNEEEESVRDLCRCREAAKKDLVRMRHRLGKFLLRRGFCYRDGRQWTKRHLTWIRTLKFDIGVDQRVFTEYLSQVLEQEQRVEELEKMLEEVSQQEPYKTPVSWLRCFHGIDTVTAINLVAEIYTIERFQTARQLMAYLGLTPGQHSSGERERRGRITKTGNSRVRRLLVEAAWQYQRSGVEGPTLKRRREGQPKWVIRIAKKAHKRLNRRYWRLVRQGKLPNKAVISVARELAGFIWGVLHTQAEVAQQLQVAD